MNRSLKVLKTMIRIQKKYVLYRTHHRTTRIPHRSWNKHIHHLQHHQKNKETYSQPKKTNVNTKPLVNDVYDYDGRINVYQTHYDPQLQ